MKTLRISAAVLAAGILTIISLGWSHPASARQAGAAASGFPLVIQICGQSISYATPPKRAVTLNQPATEILRSRDRLAAWYCDYLYVVKAGALVASGRPEAVLTAELIRDVYGVRADVTVHPITHRPHVVFLPQREEPPPALC